MHIFQFLSLMKGLLLISMMNIFEKKILLIFSPGTRTSIFIYHMFTNQFHQSLYKISFLFMLILLFLHILTRSEVNIHINDDSNENEKQERTEEHSLGLQDKAKYFQQKQEEIQIFEPNQHFNANNINTPTRDSTEINSTDFNNTNHNSTNYESNNTDQYSTNYENNSTDHNSTNYENNSIDHNSTKSESNGTYQDQYLEKIEELIKSYFDKLVSKLDGISKQLKTNFKIQNGEFSKNSSYD